MGAEIADTSSSNTEEAMLILGERLAFFEPSNNLSDVFYDRGNQKIVTVRNDGSMGITAKGFAKDNDVNFRIKATNKIGTVSFSPDMKVAAVQRDHASVDFIFLDQKLPDESHPVVMQNTKKRSAVIMVEWVGNSYVFIITNYALELYYVNTKKRTLKFVRDVNVSTEWAVYYPQSQLIICASSINAAMMNPFTIQNGVIHKLNKFEVDFGCCVLKPKLTCHDVMVASIYQKLYLLSIKSDSYGINRQVNMYEIQADNKPTELSHILILNVDDHVGLHVIDNLVLVHHKKSAKTFIFDIRLKDKKTTDHMPAFSTSIDVSNNLKRTYPNAFNYYPWLILPPSFTVDPRCGIFADVQLKLERIQSFIDDKGKVLRFVMNRSNVEQLMLSIIQQFIQEESLSLFKVAQVLQEIFITSESEARPLMLGKADSVRSNLVCDPYIPMRANQSDILRSIFEPLGDSSHVNKKWLSNVLLEFLLILKRKKCSIDNYLPELLIKVLSDAKEYGKLQQILQHRVIDDSKFLAFHLIEISKDHPPFFQLAVDMLARRGNQQHILSLLLEKNQVVDAIRCLKDPSIVDTTLCLKILDAAWRTTSRQTKYMVFTYLRDILKLSFLTLPSDQQFEKYAREFKALFQQEELLEAENRFRWARISSSPISLNEIAALTPNSSFETHSLNEAPVS